MKNSLSIEATSLKGPDTIHEVAGDNMHNTIVPFTSSQEVSLIIAQNALDYFKRHGIDSMDFNRWMNLAERLGADQSKIDRLRQSYSQDIDWTEGNKINQLVESARSKLREMSKNFR